MNDKCFLENSVSFLNHVDIQYIIRMTTFKKQDHLAKMYSCIHK